MDKIVHATFKGDYRVNSGQSGDKVTDFRKSLSQIFPPFLTPKTIPEKHWFVREIKFLTLNASQ